MQFDFCSPAPVAGYTPYPFQLDAIKAIQAALERRVRRGMLALATGLGKTVIGAQLPAALNCGPMLWLAHRRELLNQARDELRQANPKLTVHVEQGDRYADHDADIVVGSVPTLGREGTKRRDKFMRGFGLVFVDEAHHLGQSYLDILKCFRAGQEGGPPLIGATATPFRTDRKVLANLYDEIVYEKSLRQGIEEGYLCRIRAVRVQGTGDLRNIKKAGEDFSQSELEAVTNTDLNNSLLCSAIEQHAEGRRTILVFCPGVNAAQVVALQLRKRGHTAECVTAKTPIGERANTMMRFQEGKTRILTNYDVCTEGWNCRPIDTIVAARPTLSLLLFTQMIGRGTRLSPETGKQNCLVIDLVHLCGKHQIQTTSTLFGLREMDLLGEDVLDAVTICEVAEQRGLQVADGDRIDNVSERSAQLDLLVKRTISVGTKAEDVDVFAACRIGKDVERESEFPWIRMPNDTYVLPIDGPKRAVLRRGVGGIWDCTVNGTGLNCGKGDTPPFREADKVVKRFAGYRLCDDRPPMPWWRILSQKAKWRRLPATDGQRAALRKWGVRVPDVLMRGVASTMLETLRLRREGNNG